MRDLLKFVLDGPRPPFSNPPKEREVFIAIGMAINISENKGEIREEAVGPLMAWSLRQPLEDLLQLFPQPSLEDFVKEMN